MRAQLSTPYRELGAANRSQALLRLHELGLRASPAELPAGSIPDGSGLSAAGTAG